MHYATKMSHMSRIVTLTVIGGFHNRAHTVTTMEEKDEPSCNANATDTSEKIDSPSVLPNNKGEIVLYQPDESLELNVFLESETVWLTQQQIAELFDTSRTSIVEHIKHIYEEGELITGATCRNFRHVRIEGGRQVARDIPHYDLDMIISVGYRVNSKRATKFRQWATRVLRDYLLKGHVFNQRLERIEHRLGEHDKKIDFFVRTNLPPVQGIFFEGQIFDAHAFVSDLIRSAKESVVLIDNYVDESVLLLLSKRLPNVTAEIRTKRISPELRLDIEKHNAQYDPVNVYETERFHDRFLIIDGVVYHIGASFKDLGKKLFAFSKMDIEDTKILDL